MNTISGLQLRYTALCHAVQSGVAMERSQQHPNEGLQAARDHKHLRVGINTSKCDHAALAQLCMDKGLFTELEYWEALVRAMEAEKTRIEAELSRTTGANVTLA